MTRAVLAVFRPRRGDIELFVEDGGEHASVPLSIAEATQIHGALGRALMLAKCAKDPISAVQP